MYITLPLLLTSFATVAYGLPTQYSPNRPRKAPIRRQADIPDAQVVAPDAFIVALVPDSSVDPNNRAAWVESTLGKNGVSIQSLDSDTMTTDWNETVFNGFAGRFTDDALEALRSSPQVAYIEPDVIFHTTALEQQTNAPWGISRLSLGSNKLPEGSNSLALDYKYTYDSAAGEGSDVYVIDTGIRTSHEQFEGRATFLKTFSDGVDGDDANGHGTHVAGTIAGSVFGVAKKANVLAVKVMGDDGSGSTSNIISGISFAAQQAQLSGRPSVASMSLGGPSNRAMDDAVVGALKLGLPFVVAAGNDGNDASRTSPAHLGGANGDVITVGAISIDDKIASYSNYGTNVDVFAPGSNILSCGIASDDAIKKLSGTSMATPHISGLAALIMSQEGVGKLSPADLKSKIKGLAVSGAVGGVPKGTSDLLGWNGAQAS